MQTKFKPGDRVKSNVYGFRFGSPGTIVGKAQLQYGGIPRYRVQFDKDPPGQLAVLKGSYLIPIEGEQNGKTDEA